MFNLYNKKKTFYIGNDKLKIDLSNLDCLGYGATNYVYRYNENVLKINHKIDDDITNFQYLKDADLNLKLISIPTQIIYNKDSEFVGTVAKYIDGISKKEEYLELLLNMNNRQLLENIIILKRDLDVLTKNKITAYDLSLNNIVISNSQIHHIDYGCFFRNTRYPSNNDRSLYLFLDEMINTLYRYYHNKHYLSINYDWFDFLSGELDNSSNVESLIKKL